MCIVDPDLRKDVLKSLLQTNFDNFHNNYESAAYLL